jgi:hypothetical protein
MFLPSLTFLLLIKVASSIDTVHVEEDNVVVINVSELDCVSDGVSSVDDYVLTDGPDSGIVYYSPSGTSSKVLISETESFEHDINIVYEPTLNYYGKDSLTFKRTGTVCDVDILVIPSSHDAPVVNDDSIVIDIDGSDIYRNDYIALNPLLNDVVNNNGNDNSVCYDTGTHSSAGLHDTFESSSSTHFIDVADILGLDVLQSKASEFVEGSCPHTKCYVRGFSRVCTNDCTVSYLQGAATIGDIDGNGLDDIIILQHGSPPRIYRNLHSGRFEEITDTCGVMNVMTSHGGHISDDEMSPSGIALGDVDNDGDLDIYISTYGMDQYGFLWINDGTGHFTEESKERGVDNIHVLGKTLGMTVTFGDFDNDGYIDLITSEWRSDYFYEDARNVTEGFKVYKNWGERAHACDATSTSPDVNNCKGYFEDVTYMLDKRISNSVKEFNQFFTQEPGVYVFSCNFVDLNNDSYDDLYCVIDFGGTRIFMNDGNGGFVLGETWQPPQFSDQVFGKFPRPISFKKDENGRRRIGGVDAMGYAMSDFDEDGELDIINTGIFCAACLKNQFGMFGNEDKTGNRLYSGSPGSNFTLRDITDAYGVKDGGWGWGVDFIDFDNDGDLDIAQVNGLDQPGLTEDWVVNLDNSRLWENTRSCESSRPLNSCDNSPKLMQDRSAETGFVGTKSKGRGLISFDFDYDGDLDLIVLNNEAKVQVFENTQGNRLDWVKVKVHDHASHGGKESEGALVYMKERADDNPKGTDPTEQGQSTQWKLRRYGSTSNFLGMGQRVVHYGLGAVSNERVYAIKVFWPKFNNTVIVYDVPRNAVLDVTGLSGTDEFKEFRDSEVIPECGKLEISKVIQPINGGYIVIDSTKKYLKYYPTLGFNDTFTFEYRVVDGASGENIEGIGEITVDVNLRTSPGEEVTGTIPTGHPPINGYGNNIGLPLTGCPMTKLSRFMSTDYEGDGLGDDMVSDRPSPRLISNTIFDQNDDAPSSGNMNDLSVHMGQFLVHDTDFSTPFANGDLSSVSTIPIPECDSVFDEECNGDQVMRFRRSGISLDTGTGQSTPRQQVNKVTSYIDLSHVYGPGMGRLYANRQLVDGKMKIKLPEAGEDYGNLAFNDADVQLANPLEKDLSTQLLSGDNRANVHPSLLSLHTLFHLAHNDICDELIEANPAMSDDDIFNEARTLLIARFQSIVYEEFLPTLLGPNLKLAKYTGYKEDILAEISNEFATAAGRYGHSQVNSVQKCFQEDGSVCEGGHITLRDAYFSSFRFLKAGMTNLLRGMLSHRAQEIDTKMVPDLRNFLFGTNTVPLDLTSINIQRGRDHGLADYNTARSSMGLEKITKFIEICPSNPKLASDLEDLYGDVDKIDLFVGGLAEDHVKGGNVGPTFGNIMRKQFETLRDGDRFYYENNDAAFTDKQKAQIKSYSFCDMLKSKGVTCAVKGQPFLWEADEEEWYEKWSADALPILTSNVAVALLSIAGTVLVFKLNAMKEMRRKEWSTRAGLEGTGKQVDGI